MSIYNVSYQNTQKIRNPLNFKRLIQKNQQTLLPKKQIFRNLKLKIQTFFLPDQKNELIFSNEKLQVIIIQTYSIHKNEVLNFHKYLNSEAFLKDSFESNVFIPFFIINQYSNKYQSYTLTQKDNFILTKQKAVPQLQCSILPGKRILGSFFNLQQILQSNIEASITFTVRKNVLFRRKLKQMHSQLMLSIQQININSQNATIMKKSQQIVYRFQELKISESDNSVGKIKNSNYKKQFKFKALQKFRGKSLQKLTYSHGCQKNSRQEGISEDESMSSSLDYFSFGQILQ